MEDVRAFNLFKRNKCFLAEINSLLLKLCLKTTISPIIHIVQITHTNTACETPLLSRVAVNTHVTDYPTQLLDSGARGQRRLFSLRLFYEKRQAIVDTEGFSLIQKNMEVI